MKILYLNSRPLLFLVIIIFIYIDLILVCFIHRKDKMVIPFLEQQIILCKELRRTPCRNYISLNHSVIRNTRLWDQQSINF